MEGVAGRRGNRRQAGLDAGRAGRRLRQPRPRPAGDRPGRGLLRQWCLAIALGVYGFEVGGAVAVGVVALVRLLPGALASPFAGLLGDRFPRRDVLIGSGLVVTVVLAGDAASRPPWTATPGSSPSSPGSSPPRSAATCPPRRPCSPPSPAARRSSRRPTSPTARWTTSASSPPPSRPASCCIPPGRRPSSGWPPPSPWSPPPG